MPTLNITETLTDMLTAIKGETGKGWIKIRSTAESFAASNRERLEMIASLRLSGDLNQEEFLSRLEDEKRMLENQLLALNVLAKATIQNAVNAAFGVLVKAVGVLLGGV